MCFIYQDICYWRNCLHVANVTEFIAAESGAGQERFANLLFSPLYCHLGEKLSLKKKALRWLDWIFLRGYLPSLSINYVATSKDMGKRLPQLYYIKMKICYDLGFIAIGVAMAT